MRTTIDLPDELFRQAKAKAALDGLKLRELIARYVEEGLKGTAVKGAPRRRQEQEACGWPRSMGTSLASTGLDLLRLKV